MPEEQKQIAKPAPEPGRVQVRAHERRKRHDGTELDSTKNLAEFVQSFPQIETATPAPESPTPTPTPAPAAPPVATATQEDEFSGLSQQEIVEKLKAEREQRAQLQRDLDQQKLQQQIENAANRAVSERMPQPPPPAPAAPQEDPRWAAVDDLWFTKPSEARALMKQIQDDEYKQRLAEDRAKTKQEVFAELDDKQRKAQGEYAYNAALQQLVALGVPREQINPNRITSVYTVITRPPSQKAPNQYYTEGGPLNPNVIVSAWKELFGVPQMAAAPAPIPPTPPGSSRPAPAATPPRTNENLPTLTSDQTRDIMHMATVYGHDPQKMINRRRERLAKERG